MSLVTHDTKWRLLVGAAPLFGVAFFVWAAAQGETDVARSPMARAILAAVAALGAAVAWWTARQMRAAPTVPVATASAMARAGALPELVALRGRARALPDAVPLISPDGELCLWFTQGEQSVESPGTPDSVRPFLLVDESGECVVLPAGADVTGTGSVPAAAARSGLPGNSEIDGPYDPTEGGRLLRNGDRVRVTGRFIVASAEALALQAEAASQVARAEATPGPHRNADPLPFRDLRAAAAAGAPFVAAPPLARHALALPVIAAPETAQPLVIRIGPDEGEGGVYGLLAVVDGLVLLVTSSLVAWSMLVPG